VRTIESTSGRGPSGKNRVRRRQDKQYCETA
jgi:hypothetical protein